MCPHPKVSVIFVILNCHTFFQPAEIVSLWFSVFEYALPAYTNLEKFSFSHFKFHPIWLFRRKNHLWSLREGDTIELQCQVTGKPKPIILWSRADKEVAMPDGSMQMESVMEHWGLWMCLGKCQECTDVRPASIMDLMWNREKPWCSSSCSVSTFFSMYFYWGGEGKKIG